MKDSLSGAREGRPSALRRLVAKASADDLCAFVVPGPDVARARGIDPGAAGLGVAATPRHAGVILLLGELPAGLKKAAAVAYAQMPRPRAVLAVGAGDVSPLPGPDVSVAATQADLAAGVDELRRLFAAGAFAEETTAFYADEIETETTYACPMHPEVTSGGPGSCPRCGMDLVPRESTGGSDHEGHHGAHDSHAGMGHGSVDEDAGGHGDHRDMGFMSMVEMTQGTPRSSDGLQMEWADAPFGPLFPGLPGGLAMSFTLDGDTVAVVKSMRGIDGWGPESLDNVTAREFPERLAFLSPLSPIAYRVLALRALGVAAGVETDEETSLGQVGALERERAASHLGWLSGFGRLLGYSWLWEHAGRLQVALLRAADAGEVGQLEPEVGKFVRRVIRTPLLARRLEGIGTLPDDAEISGPVARASGLARDARSQGTGYRHLGFEPVVRDGGDAFARLRVRLAEIEQSLGLVRRAGVVSFTEVKPAANAGDVGGATVETPRGAATLRVTLREDAVEVLELRTPSSVHQGFVGAVAEQREVADALVGVASLDISPWEVTG